MILLSPRKKKIKIKQVPSSKFSEFIKTKFSSYFLQVVLNVAYFCIFFSKMTLFQNLIIQLLIVYLDFLKKISSILNENITKWTKEIEKKKKKK